MEVKSVITVTLDEDEIVELLKEHVANSINTKIESLDQISIDYESSCLVLPSEITFKVNT